MSLKKAFQKMGLVEEEVTPVTTGKTAPAPTTQAAAPSRTYTPYTPAPSVDPDISDMLNKSLQQSKLAGFDYLKFTSAVEKMKTSGASEDSRYKMAFATAQEMGVDKAELVKSGEHYLGVLQEDEDDFKTDCTQYSKKEITARESKISDIESTITDLTKQLADLQKQHETLSQELQEETDRLETRKASFSSTLQVFRATIESNIQKINQYLN